MLHPEWVLTSSLGVLQRLPPDGFGSSSGPVDPIRQRGDQFNADDILTQPLQPTSTECRFPPLCAEFCSEHDVWRLNVAHTFFMQVCVAVRVQHMHVLRVVIHTLGGIAAVRRGLARSQLVQRPL